jgi:serine kinase of HPr protein (carbohydrate metabolism regulator)
MNIENHYIHLLDINELEYLYDIESYSSAKIMSNVFNKEEILIVLSKF